MKFEFATAGRIVFGPGSLAQIGKLVDGLGKKAFVVTGRGAADPSQVLQLLEQQGIMVIQYPISGEPTVEVVKAGVDLVRSEGCQFVLGYGGGSVLDAGKAIAGLATNPGDIFEYLEVIGQGKALQNPSLPYIAIPTTAGTGSEVTRNAVITSPEHRVKVSIRSPYLLPQIALVDSDLTLSLPPAITAATGMDALAQVIEPYVSAKANPMTDGYCRLGIQNAAWALQRAYHDGNDSEAREAMALTSLMGGLSLANAGLGAVHGFAGPIGGSYTAPHGAICAVLLAPVIKVNVRALQERLPDSLALPRYLEISRWLTGNSKASLEDGIRWLEELCSELKIPRLREYGITSADFSTIVEKSSVASSMKANPIKLTADEMREILELAD